MLVAFAAQLACSTKTPADPAPATDPMDASMPGPMMMGTDGGHDAGADARCDEVRFTPTPPDNCGDYVRFPCGMPQGIAPRENCFLNLGDCAAICPDIHFNCRVIEGYCSDGGTVRPDDAGTVVVDCATCLTGAGRVPAGLERAAMPEVRSALGAWFARAAHLEAASVHAFRALRKELEELGAPAELVLAARDAERDEVRHTRAVAKLARRFGARYVRPRVHAVPPRTREAIAIDNAVEGCVRETFGALVVAWQASRIEDPEMKRTFAAIAEDELRHAELSWAIASWMHDALDHSARGRVQTACREAIRELGAAGAPSPELALVIGLPTSRESDALLGELSRSLWSSAIAA